MILWYSAYITLTTFLVKQQIPFLPLLISFSSIFSSNSSISEQLRTTRTNFRRSVDFLRERKEDKINENKSIETLDYELKSTARKVVGEPKNNEL